MFSFHKPRVYRSADGCCICRAKSSSSRFTDSCKYEADSMKCFALKCARRGEICNACVLLVKRYKRLPVGSTRHWGHVVDARAGPGTKSLTKHRKHRDQYDEGGESTATPAAPAVIATTKRQRTQSGSGGGAENRSGGSISEKFAKIFKKAKKINTGAVKSKTSPLKASSLAALQVPVGGAKQSTTGSLWHVLNDDLAAASLPTTPDSLDSGGEERGLMSPPHNSNALAVEFQTQTRAAAHRQRQSACVLGGGVSAAALRRTFPRKVGSKRRKCLAPRRHRRSAAEEAAVDFYDAAEWRARLTCCGWAHESDQLPGVLLLDEARWEACSWPRTIPVVVPAALASHTNDPSVAAAKAAVPSIAPAVTPTQALKKHHLFFKRQSEAFPHLTIAPPADAPPAATAIVSPTTALAAVGVVAPFTAHSSGPTRASGVTISSVTNNNSNSSAPPAPVAHGPSGGGAGDRAHHFLHKLKTANTGRVHKPMSATSALATSMRMRGDLIGNEVALELVKAVDKTVALAAIGSGHKTLKATPTMSAIAVQQQQHQQRYYGQQMPLAAAVAQQQPLTTAMASPSPTLSSSSSSSSTKFSDNSSDSGFDENLQDRKSASPMQEDNEKKLHARAPPPHTHHGVLPAHAHGGVHTMFLASGVQIQGQQPNLVLTGNEMAAKLLHNRKAGAQPHQQQQQQLLQRQHTKTAATITSRPAHAAGSAAPSAAAMTVGVAVTGLKATTGGASGYKIAIGGTMSSPNAISQAPLMVGGGSTTPLHINKMRAIYNNNNNNSVNTKSNNVATTANAIQHENGVTTIVPAHSLAATTQTAAMHNAAMAPSTVTITPALPPSPHSVKKYMSGLPAGTAVTPLTVSNHHNQALGGHHHQQHHHVQQQHQQHNHHSGQAGAGHHYNNNSSSSSNNNGAAANNHAFNSKIILVKATSGATGHAAGAAMAPASTAALKYNVHPNGSNNLAAATLAAGVPPPGAAMKAINSGNFGKD